MTLSRNPLRSFRSLLKRVVGRVELTAEKLTLFDGKVNARQQLNNQKNLFPKWWEEIENRPPLFEEETYLFLKRLLDIGLIVIAAPLVGGVMAVCAILLKIESPKASVFFLQERTGKDGKRFKMYKFRTMVKDAEKRKEEFMHLNELEWPDFKITNDPRITRLGRILRKTSLDELPQILNIWRGEMSWVGPRPTSFSVETYDLWHTARLEAIPGLTGLWQVVGRTEMEFDERVRLDHSYIQNRSLWLDLKILVLTVTAVFKGK